MNLTELIEHSLWIALAAYCVYCTYSYSMHRLDIFGPRLVSLESRIEVLESKDNE